jgi:uncharacterized membrane protein YgcG
MNSRALLPATFLIICLMGCSRVRDSQSDPPTVPRPEEQAAPTPQLPRTFPEAKGFVNDFAEVMDIETEQALEARLSKFQEDRKVDIAVATVSSTGPESIDDYSLEMAREWKVGSEKGGLLLLVSIDDRKWRIQTDRKLETLMSDGEVKEIGDLMVPDLKRKDYYVGIKKCVDSLIESLTRKLDAK